jgi:hypothetical protein
MTITPTVFFPKLILITFLTTISLTSCSSTKTLGCKDFATISKSIDTVSLFCDGIVFENTNVIYIDLMRSNAYSEQSSICAQRILFKRGFITGPKYVPTIGTFLKTDSTYKVLPQGSDSLITINPPFYSTKVNPSDTFFIPAYRRFFRFLTTINYSQKRTTIIPDSFSNDLIEIRKKTKGRFVCFSYFEGLNSEMISGNTKAIWTVASILASGGMISVTPRQYSTLSNSVFIIDLDTKNIIFSYINNYWEEKTLLELLENSWYQDVQWKFPCRNGNCSKPGFFYNPFDIK